MSKHRQRARNKDVGETTRRRQAFARVRRSIVAIVHKHDSLPTDGSPLSEHATLLGTGFFVDEWTVATCSDVIVDYVSTAHKYGIPADEEPPYPRILYDRGSAIEFEGDRATIDTRVTEFRLVEMVQNPMSSIVLLNVEPPAEEPELRIPTLRLSRGTCEEGDELAVCGFPLGLGLQNEDVGGGIILNPSFSRVMVSSALPYPGAPRKSRMYFQIDGMPDVGQRGGPIFEPDTGMVVGILQERKKIPLEVLLAAMRIPLATHEPDSFGVPVGLGRGIHSHYVSDAVERIRREGWALGRAAKLSEMGRPMRDSTEG